MTARQKTAPAATTPVRRCAIYTRKSTSAGLEMDFNSLDAQREACERYIQNQDILGWKVIAEKREAKPAEQVPVATAPEER